MLLSTFTEIHCREQLFPFTLTRHTADIRVGMLTIRQKWAMGLSDYSNLALPLEIPANIIPGSDFFALLEKKNWEEALAQSDLYRVLDFPWQIMEFNDWALRQDFNMLTRGKISAVIPPSVNITGSGQVFFEKGVKANHCYINVESGPVYVSSKAEIMEGVMIRGPVFIGEGTIVKMGSSIYGATTLGPYCIAGGEIKNSVILGYSNKAHDGYLGDSVIGEWCNLGAGSSCSNIRNTASAVKVWLMKKKAFREVGLKCGLLMGDYSRCSINSSFNTGTVVGVSANIFKPGTLLPKYIRSFSWGPEEDSRYELEKAITDINNWMKFKNHSLSTDQINTLHLIFSNNEYQ